MSDRFRVFTPDAQYPDDGEIERKVADQWCDFQILRERNAAAVPADSWARSDALLVWHEVKIDAALIKRLDRCRIIVRAGVGYDHIDLEAAGAAGIPVCNTPDYGTSEVADHALALCLALARGIAGYQEVLRRDPIGNFNSALIAQRRIRERVMGIVGLGRIGTAVALRAKAFGMKVVAFDPYLPSGQEIALGVARLRTLRELLEVADVVSIHTALTAETRNLFDDGAFAAMRDDAVLINTARGGIVDLDALYRALRSNRIAGAGLDVFPTEPPKPLPKLLAAWRDDEEWLRGRLLLTPHAAWNSPESRSDARRLSTETLVAYLVEGTIRNCVNQEYLKQTKEVERWAPAGRVG